MKERQTYGDCYSLSGSGTGSVRLCSTETAWQVHSGTGDKYRRTGPECDNSDKELPADVSAVLTDVLRFCPQKFRANARLLLSNRYHYFINYKPFKTKIT